MMLSWNFLKKLILNKKMLHDNRQYIEDFETYVMFRRIVKDNLFHLRFRLSSDLLSHLLAEEIMFQIAFEDDLQITKKEFRKFKPTFLKHIEANNKLEETLPPDRNRIW